MTNRLTIRPHATTNILTASNPPSRLHLAESDLFDSPTSVFTPMHHAAKYAYPLIVWLHSGGSDEREVAHVLPAVSMRNYLAVGPRGTLIHDVDAPLQEAPFQEAGLDEAEGFTWRQNEDHISLAQQRVADAIRQVEDRYQIHPERIFLAGRGSGGTMAMRLAMREPHRFAGVISLDGAFPQGNTPLARVTEAREVPVFLGACGDSTRYDSTSVCSDLRLLHTAGMSVTLKHYPCEQTFGSQVFSDVDQWIMELLSAVPETSIIQ